MNIEFDTLIDRGIYPTQKLNTGDLQQHFGRPDLLPFWIADMDLPAPPAVVEKLTQRAEHGIYGYEYRPDSFYTAMQAWYAQRYGWSFGREEIEQCPGALSALAILLDQHTDEGDGIIVQTPVFFEFRLVIRKNGRKMVKNPLRLVDGRYTIDFADLAQKAADPRNKMLVLCNPHNPVGRVWTRAELTRIAEICAANDVRVVADEIHGDIVYPPHQYTPYASLSPEAAAHSFTCLSPAKTFNVAGIADGIVVIPDEAARQQFNQFADRFQINRTNIFASAAAETAYREGAPWLDALLDYLTENLRFMQTFLADQVPAVKLIQPEGTYLAWIDFRELGLEAKQLDKFLAQEAGLALNSGYWFGREGAGFARMTIGAPRALLEQAMTQLRDAVSTL